MNEKELQECERLVKILYDERYKYPWHRDYFWNIKKDSFMVYQSSFGADCINDAPNHFYEMKEFIKYYNWTKLS